MLCIDVMGMSNCVLCNVAKCRTKMCGCGHKTVFVSLPAQACDIIRCKNLALNIRDCLSLCLSEETLNAVGPFYLVSMPGEVKDPTSLHWKCVTCVLHILT